MSRRYSTQSSSNIRFPPFTPYSRGCIENIVRIVLILDIQQTLVVGTIERFLPIWLKGIALEENRLIRFLHARRLLCLGEEGFTSFK